MSCTVHLTAEMASSEFNNILLGGQEKGPDTQMYDDTHMTKDPEEDSSCLSTCKCMDMNPTPKTTNRAQKILEDTLQSDVFDENSQGQLLAFSRPQPVSTDTLLMDNNTEGSKRRITDEHKTCSLSGRELDTQVTGIPDKDFPSRGKSGDVDLTLENPSSAKKFLQHFDQYVSQNNVPQVLELSFEMPKARRKPAIKVRRLTQKDSPCLSTCKSMDMNPTPKTTNMAQKILEDTIQSDVFDENSQSQGLAFSRPQPVSTDTMLMNNNTKGSKRRITDEQKACSLSGRELDTQVSGIPDKDFPSRGKSGDVDLTLENPISAKKSLQHFNQSVSQKNVPQVLKLSFEMLKARRKPAIKVGRLTQKDFASRCKSVSEDTNKIVEKASQHFEQSLSPKKIPDVLDLTFSTPNSPQKHAIQLSRFQEEDAPYRSKSMDIDHSISPKNISEVLDLTFAMPKRQTLLHS